MSFRYLGALGLSLILVACASSKPKSDFEVFYGDDTLNIELSRDAVVGMLENGLDTTMDCDGNLDPDMKALLQPLEHKRHATASRGDGDDRVVAKRRGSQLIFIVTGTGSGHLKATLPWTVGECLLGRKTTFEGALGSSPIKVELTTENGKTIRATLS